MPSHREAAIEAGTQATLGKGERPAREIVELALDAAEPHLEAMHLEPVRNTRDHFEMVQANLKVARDEIEQGAETADKTPAERNERLKKVSTAIATLEGVLRGLDKALHNA